MRKFIEWLQEMSFATRFGVRNQWVAISAKDVQEDPELAEEIFHLIDDAYKKIGGHVDIRSPQDVVRLLSSGDMSFFKAIGMEGSEGIDALVGYKARHGKKAVVSAVSKETPSAKDAWLKYKVDSLNTSSYSEISDAAAGILLKVGVPVVEDESMVRRVLGGKPIKWYGEMPHFEVQRLKSEGIKDSVVERFKKYKGWYGRMLGDGQEHVKIMVGIPVVNDGNL